MKVSKQSISILRCIVYWWLEIKLKFKMTFLRNVVVYKKKLNPHVTKYKFNVLYFPSRILLQNDAVHSCVRDNNNAQ